jgi:hypothetical protein
MGGGTTISNIEPAAGNLRVQTATYGAAIPLIYGRTRVSGNLAWYGGFQAIPHTSTESSGGKGGGGVTQENTSFTYEAAVLMALGEGLITSVVSAWRGKLRFVGAGALGQMGLGLAQGALGQPVWGYLTTNYPSQAIAYSGFAYVYAAGYDLGSDATVTNHSFEVSTPWEATAAGDATPADIVQDILTNANHGANFPVGLAGSFSAWRNYNLAQNLVMSPALIQQKPAADWVKYFLDLSNTDVTWSQGGLKFVPLGDAACSANGASYTPNNTPAYDLTEDHFLIDGPEDDPLKPERISNDDMFNHLRVEYFNRHNEYNVEPAEAKDAADIDRRGLRTKDVVEAHAICEPAVAQLLATLLLQRELAVRNKYRFQLPWTFGLLEPLDLVTVTDTYLGLTRTPVRINSVSELDGGDFDIEAEDCPVGMASAPAYGQQAGAGYAHDYNAAPDSVAIPVFFEPPAQLTTTGLEVWIAVSGQTTQWGGCRVWASNDGISYKQVGTIKGGARYGDLSADLGTLDGNTLGVKLTGQGGQILSGAPADAANNETLMFVGDATGGEFLNYETATLTGTNAYNLTGLHRGAFYTTPKARLAHQAKVVRVDGAIGKSEPLLPEQVGQPLFFKFTSFNVYGGGEESLADVMAYSYTPLGYMLKLPPPPVKSFVFDGATKFSWSAITYPRNLIAGYKIKYQYGNNQSWPDANELNTDVITDSPYIAGIIPQGQVTFMIRPVDVYGNEAASSAVIITQLGDAMTANVLQALDYKAAGWPGYITGSAGISGGNIVATNSAGAFGAEANAAFSGITSDAAFTANYAGISYATPSFVPAYPGRLTLLHTVLASQYEVNYRPSNPAPAFASSGLQAAFPQGAAAAAFAAKPDWLSWPGSIQGSTQPYEFQIVCGVGSVQQQITRLIAQIDVPDINVRLSNVAISAAGSRLTAAAGKFSVITNVNLTLQSNGIAVDAQYTDKSAALGPNVICIDKNVSQVAAVVDALLQGY